MCQNIYIYLKHYHTNILVPIYNTFFFWTIILHLTKMLYIQMISYNMNFHMESNAPPVNFVP